MGRTEDLIGYKETKYLGVVRLPYSLKFGLCVSVSYV